MSKIEEDEFNLITPQLFSLGSREIQGYFTPYLYYARVKQS